MKERYEIANVPVKVKKAITKYCKDKGITRANYLENDKRIKSYL